MLLWLLTAVSVHRLPRPENMIGKIVFVPLMLRQRRAKSFDRPDGVGNAKAAISLLCGEVGEAFVTQPFPESGIVFSSKRRFMPTAWSACVRPTRKCFSDIQPIGPARSRPDPLPGLPCGFDDAAVAQEEITIALGLAIRLAAFLPTTLPSVLPPRFFADEKRRFARARAERGKVREVREGAPLLDLALPDAAYRPMPAWLQQGVNFAPALDGAFKLNR